MTDVAARTPDLRFRNLALAALLAVFAYKSADLMMMVLRTQPLGADFSCFWAGGKAALSDPARIFDFRYITELQGWPLGPTLRPYVYPPSALLLFVPLATLPPAVAYAVWTTLTGGFFLWAARLAGAPWWLALFPMIALAAVCGQITFLIGGLVLLGLALRDRPILAGVLFGLAAMIKPQTLVLLPIGLLAIGSWRSLFAAGATVAMLFALSALVWGPSLWLEWLAAIARFQSEVIPALPALREDQISFRTFLELAGLPGALAYLLAPVAVALVWLTFRRTPDPILRATAAFGGSLLIAPYAMHYDAALLVPGIAALLARTDYKLWPIGAAAAVLFMFSGIAFLFAAKVPTGPLPVIAGLSPLASAWLRGGPAGPAGGGVARR
jgi:hypothetical protein